MKNLEFQNFNLTELSLFQLIEVNGGQVIDRESTSYKIGHAIGAVIGQVGGGLMYAIKFFS